MLTKTRGIVLRYTRFGDSSIIVNIFTSAFGIQSYLVKGVRKTLKGSRMALFQPLSLLELVTYQRDNAQLQHLKEVKCSYIYKSLHGDIRKESLAFFITEILNRTIREVDDPAPLYHFLEQRLQDLDKTQDGLADFHLHFLIDLSGILGFGAAVAGDISGNQPLDASMHDVLSRLIAGDATLRLSAEERRDVLGVLLNSLRRHVGDFGQLKSLAVLRDLLA